MTNMRKAQTSFFCVHNFSDFLSCSSWVRLGLVVGFFEKPAETWQSDR